MPEESMWDILIQQAMREPWYQECRAEVRKLEPWFINFREGLSGEDRDKLDDYISACEGLEDALTLTAWELYRKSLR